MQSGSLWNEPMFFGYNENVPYIVRWTSKTSLSFYLGTESYGLGLRNDAVMPKHP